MISRRQFGTLVAAGGALSVGPVANAYTTEPPPIAGSSKIEILQAQNVPGNVEIAIYTPPGYAADAAKKYPLLLLLHGGNGSARDLLRFVTFIDNEMRMQRLEPMVIVTPSAGRSLYMDFLDGSQSWEKFIIGELLPHLRKNLNVTSDRNKTFIGGWSMGGLGSLRIAFKNPDLFAAVAAIEPAIEPALRWEDVGENVKFWRPQSVLETMFGAPISTGYWAANNPATIAQNDPARLINLNIYIEVGDQDMLHLYEGAEFLHRILFDAGLAHEYRLVHGAEHVGPSLVPRLLDALSFIGRQIKPPMWIDKDVEAVRVIMDNQKRAIGMAVEKPDPRKLKGRMPRGTSN